MPRSECLNVCHRVANRIFTEMCASYTRGREDDGVWYQHGLEFMDAYIDDLTEKENQNAGNVSVLQPAAVRGRKRD